MNDRVITGSIVARSPLHFGGGPPSEVTDLPLNRDLSGEPYIAGTHIAGRLRAIATQLAPSLGYDACQRLNSDLRHCSCPVCAVFGAPIPPEDGADGPGDDSAIRASRLWCFDATLSDDGHIRSLVRDGVGIDRATGASAAAYRAKYDAEWIPDGTRFTLRLELQRGGEDPERDEDILAIALSEWTAGRGRLGASAARGGGGFDLKDVEFRRAPLESKEELLAFLEEDQPTRRGAVEGGWLDKRVKVVRDRGKDAESPPELPPAAVTHYVSLTVDLHFTGAVLVSDPAAAFAHGLDGVPTFATPDWTDPVLPGSSVRGVLRSQVERIARTIASHAAGDLAQYAVAPGACSVFGPSDLTLWSCADLIAKWEEEEGDRTDKPPQPCIACRLFGNRDQGSRLWIEDARLAPKKPTSYRLRDFVAIDRFTGGARAGAKFDALPLYGATFRVSLLLWNAVGPEIAALYLALRDLDDGLATIGAGGAKGFGRAAVERIELRHGWIGSRKLKFLDAHSVDPSGVFDVKRWEGNLSEFVGLLPPAWSEEFVRQCKERTRPQTVAEELKRDTYFGEPAFELYGARIESDAEVGGPAE